LLAGHLLKIFLFLQEDFAVEFSTGILLWTGVILSLFLKFEIKWLKSKCSIVSLLIPKFGRTISTPSDSNTSKSGITRIHEENYQKDRKDLRCPLRRRLGILEPVKE
jgi:hypothetical protein